MENKSGYKIVGKGIALFGGLQIYKILLSVIRTKCSAVFLGPNGLGVFSLITSTLTSIEMMMNCGLGISAVKDIASAQNDGKEVATVYLVLRRFVWIIGLSATFFCILGSKYLSSSAFGNSEYTLSFVFAAITLLISQLITGQGALLTGLRKYKFMARLNIWSNTLGLAVTIVLYLLWGVEAIVPVIVSTALLNLIFSAYFAKKIILPKVSLSLRETWQKGKGMLKAGILISLGGAVSSLAGYIIRIFLSHASGTCTVGLFTATFSLVNTYLGMVVSAIDSDYYPRLCMVEGEPADFNNTINQQIEMLVLLLSPLILAFVVFSPVMISLFYSDKFQSASGLMVLLALSMFFYVPAKTLGMAFLAKGDSKRFFVYQAIFVAYTLALNILGFHCGTLLGLGCSYVAAYLVFLMQTIFTCRHYYRFRIEKRIIMKFCLYLAFLIAACVLSLYAKLFMKYMAGSVIVGVASLVAFIDLNSKLNLVNYIRRKL